MLLTIYFIGVIPRKFDLADLTMEFELLTVLYLENDFWPSYGMFLAAIVSGNFFCSIFSGLIGVGCCFPVSEDSESLSLSCEFSSILKISFFSNLIPIRCFPIVFKNLTILAFWDSCLNSAECKKEPSLS